MDVAMQQNLVAGSRKQGLGDTAWRLEASLAVSGDPRVVLVHAPGGSENVENSTVAGRTGRSARPTSTSRPTST